MGNTDNNWWLKVTWVLKGHEISFNSSPESPPPSPPTQLRPQRKRHTYTAVNHYAWREPYPLWAEKWHWSVAIDFVLVDAVGRGIERGLKGCEMEDMDGKCWRWEAAIMQPSRTPSGCLVFRDTQQQNRTFSASSGPPAWPLGSSKTPRFLLLPQRNAFKPTVRK